MPTKFYFLGPLRIWKLAPHARKWIADMIGLTDDCSRPPTASQSERMIEITPTMTRPKLAHFRIAGTIAAMKYAVWFAGRRVDEKALETISNLPPIQISPCALGKAP
jgi:hypothetical protein